MKKPLLIALTGDQVSDLFFRFSLNSCDMKLFKILNKNRRDQILKTHAELFSEIIGDAIPPEELIQDFLERLESNDENK